MPSKHDAAACLGDILDNIGTIHNDRPPLKADVQTALAKGGSAGA